jgi:RNA methyltransferase, TrmH family
MLKNSEVISSSGNRWIALAKELSKSSAARQKHRLAFVEGIHLCSSFLSTQKNHTESVLLVTQDFEQNSEVAALVLAWQGRLLRVTEKAFASISQVQNGPGVALLASLPENKNLHETVGDIVYLDGLQDPGNVGTIIRSAAAVGISCVVTATATVSLWAPKVLRAGMGAHFDVTLHEGVGIETLLTVISPRQVMLATGHGSQSVFQTDLKPACVWVFGNEGQGLDLPAYDALNHSALKHLQPKLAPFRKVQIPIQSVESLNVASAAAVCFFEQWRQRH